MDTKHHDSPLFSCVAEVSGAGMRCLRHCPPPLLASCCREGVLFYSNSQLNTGEDSRGHIIAVWYGNTHEIFGGFGALPVAPVSEAEGRVTDLWVGAQLPKHAHHPTHTPFEQLAVHHDASAFCMLFKLTVRRWWPEVSVGARLPVPRMFESPARALQDTGSASVGYLRKLT